MTRAEMMTRKEIIKYLEYGEFSSIAGKDVFISFGQLPPEAQEVAMTIPNDWFEYFRPDGTFAPNAEPLKKNITYKLNADYIDKPKEPEYEYFEIYAEGGWWSFIHRNRTYTIEQAIALVGFLGYATDRDQRDGFAQTFTPDMIYVVIKKEAK